MKKTIILFLLLTTPLSAASRYWVSGGDGNWSNTNNWSASPGGASGASVPGATNGQADTAIFTSASGTGTATIDTNVPSGDTALSGLVMSGYGGTLAFGTYDVDVDGSIALDGTLTASSGAVLYGNGDFTKTSGMANLPSGLEVQLDGTGDVTCNSVAGGKLVINTSQTHTAVDAASWDSFNHLGGTYADGGYAHTIAGNINYVAGDPTVSGIWTMSSSGNLSWNRSADSIDFTLAASQTATLTANVWTNLLDFKANSTVNPTVNENFSIAGGANDNFWTQDATATVAVEVKTYTTSDRTTGGAITLTDKDFIVRRAAGGNGLGVDGDIDLGTGDLDIDNTSGVVLFRMRGYDLICNNVVVGNTANDVTLKLNSGTHTIAGNISDGPSASATNTIEFSTSKIVLTGTLDGDSITCQSDAGAGNHAEVHGGTVSNVSLPVADQALDCTDSVTNGGGNVNVWFSGTLGVHSVIGGGIIGSGQQAN